MCDTLVATPEVTANQATIFGKNSDREPNEAHELVKIPAADYPAGSRVRCTYIEIPQAEHTYAVLLARPFWIWGAEMGTNEYGVAIGNEAVFTRLPYVKEKALTGMDLLRLGLERGKSALEALHVMTDLLSAYGQGGNCGFQHPFYYHNSFILADPHQAWVLETAGPHWAAKQIHGVYSISNGLTLGNDFDLTSPDLVSFAVQKGWCKGREDFHFARCYSDFLYTRLSDCRSRCSRTTDLLMAKKGQITAGTFMAALRDHGEVPEEGWGQDRGITGAEVCMHASFGPVRASQSVGSMVSILDARQPAHFLTGTSAPCTSLFKPVWLEAGLPDLGPAPQGVYDPQSLFWQHELLHRHTLLDYSNYIQIYQQERDALEAQLVDRAMEMTSAPVGERLEFSTRCFAEARAAEGRWLECVRRTEPKRRPGWLFKTAWEGFNREAGMPSG